jgi:hypothetical protein
MEFIAVSKLPVYPARFPDESYIYDTILFEISNMYTTSIGAVVVVIVEVCHS